MKKYNEIYSVDTDELVGSIVDLTNDHVRAVQQALENKKLFEFENSIKIDLEPYVYPNTTPIHVPPPPPPNPWVPPNNHNFYQHQSTYSPRPVDDQAPDNPELTKGDTVMILTPHTNTWVGHSLNYPPLISPDGLDDDGRVTLFVRYELRFVAGQQIIYLGDAEAESVLLDSYVTTDTSFTQFLLEGKLFYMDKASFEDLRYVKI